MSLLALITFLGADKGGRLAPPQSGFHPQIELKDGRYSCRVESVGDEVEFPFERPCRVRLTLLTRPAGQLEAMSGQEIRLYEGGKLVGTGSLA